jgi:hypothetical protein
VTNANTGQPVGSAQVTVEGTTLGALTTDDGMYAIAAVQGRRSCAYAASATSTTRSVPRPATSRRLRPRADLGVTRRGRGDRYCWAGRCREVGNIGTISADQLATAPKQNVSDLLQGQVDCVQQFSNEGQVGSGTTIAIRGLSSVTQSSEPLIYIDGVRMNNQTYMNNTLTRTTAMGNPGPAGAQNSPKPLDNLNPDDVLRIEVIRGPAATTLYGTEAAAGVIQIFTKRGQLNGRAQWSHRPHGGVRT